MPGMGLTGVGGNLRRLVGDSGNGIDGSWRELTGMGNGDGGGFPMRFS